MNPHNRIQILDLHTQNPLLSYRNRIYTCAWSSTLGTDIFLTRPSTSLPPSITPLLSLPNVSIIGTSCINLTARAATVVPKADKAPPQQPPPTTSTNRSNSISAPEPIKIPLADSAPNSRHKQAAFLESLMALKAAKGERDQVTVHAVKSSQGTGWRARKRLEQELLENLAPDGGNHGDASTGGATEREPKRARRGIASGGRRLGRPRGSRARGSRAGDMERELIFAANEEVGDDGKGADKTPVKWEDVEGGTDGVVDAEQSRRGVREVVGEEAVRGEVSETEPGAGGREGETEADVEMGEAR
ncbi:MAG: hypothetical protein Q9210_006724 [Variospora velana]